MSVIIQPSYSPATELTHARIGYESIAYGKTPTVSNSASGYPAIAATYPTTYEFWKPAAVPATWAIDNAVAVACDYVGLVGDFNGGIVDVQSSNDGSTWITQVSGQITGRVTMFLFQPVTARYWRIQVSNQIPSVSVVYIGQALAMQRRIYQGHSPLTLSRNTEMINNMSEGGQYLGRSIVRQGVATDALWSHLKADWYRENFDPFVRSARTMPFFFAWRPSQFGQELGFVWTDGDIQPQNTGPRDYMSVSLNMRGVYNTSRLLLPGSYDLRPSQILTASRASTATYIDGSGVLQTAAVDVPRFQDGSLLVEGASTNLCAKSEKFDEWVNNGLAIAVNTETAPDGSTTADVSTGLGTRYFQIFPLPVGIYSFSVFVKPANPSLAIRLYRDGTGQDPAYGSIVPSTGLWAIESGAGVSMGLQLYGNGWFRIWIVFNKETTNEENVHIYPLDASAHAWWGAHVEVGGVVTTYIPTTTAPVTRAADLIQVLA